MKLQRPIKGERYICKIGDSLYYCIISKVEIRKRMVKVTPDYSYRNDAPGVNHMPFTYYFLDFEDICF